MTIIAVLIVLLGSIVLSTLANWLVLNFAKTLGIRNTNDVSIRWSNESKPSLGGISMYFVFLFTGLIVALAFIDIVEEHQKEYLGLFVATSLAFAMGLADDAYNTKPFFKLAIQILCGVILAFSGNSIHLSEWEGVNMVFTVVWVVTLMNSLNMLDNMDGITATVSCCVLAACLFVFILLYGWQVNIWTVLMFSSIGTLIGFLFYNLHPSKMFMGDGGSQFLGITIAFFTGKFLFPEGLMEGYLNWKGLLLAFVALTPAAVDSITVVINRLKKGKSPMVGGKDHTTHHLVYSGLNDRQVWRVFLSIGLISIGFVLLSFWSFGQMTYVGYVLGVGWFVFIFYYLYRNTIRFKNPAE